MTKNVGGGTRTTTHINRRVTQSIFRGVDFSAAIGRPLNNYVVIHLHESPAAAAATLFERIRHKFRDWWNRHAKKDVAAQLPPPLYTYTLENPNGAPHVNWVIHIPASLQAEFEAKLPRWVERVQGAVGKLGMSR